MFEKEAKELFGEMRMLTKEEINLRDKMYDNMSTPTGVNFFDLLEDIGLEQMQLKQIDKVMGSTHNVPVVLTT